MSGNSRTPCFRPYVIASSFPIWLINRARRARGSLIPRSVRLLQEPVRRHEVNSRLGAYVEAGLVPGSGPLRPEYRE
jgi:hypothetical protein